MKKNQRILISFEDRKKIESKIAFKKILWFQSHLDDFAKICKN